MRVPFSAEDRRKYEQGYLAYSGRVAEGVGRLIDDLKARQGHGDPAIDRLRLSVDEWGIVRQWQPDPDGPGVGIYEVYYPLGDGIAIGRALHELIRSAEVVEIAQWAQTVNVIGAIKTSRTHASMGSVGHLLTLYRKRLGGSLVPTELADDVPIDAVAAWDKKAQTLAIGLINYSPQDEVSVMLEIAGLRGLGPATAWRIHGPSLDAINIPGQPESITTVQLPESIDTDKSIGLPPHSITVLQARE
jgi:alpha-L-arabinofuranosidase